MHQPRAWCEVHLHNFYYKMHSQFYELKSLIGPKVLRFGAIDGRLMCCAESACSSLTRSELNWSYLTWPFRPDSWPWPSQFRSQLNQLVPNQRQFQSCNKSKYWKWHLAELTLAESALWMDLQYGQPNNLIQSMGIVTLDMIDQENALEEHMAFPALRSAIYCLAMSPRIYVFILSWFSRSF